jgi:hypothetical protein
MNSRKSVPWSDIRPVLTQQLREMEADCVVRLRVLRAPFKK